MPQTLFTIIEPQEETHCVYVHLGICFMSITTCVYTCMTGIALGDHGMSVVVIMCNW